MNWLKNCFKKVWEGFLGHIGTCLATLILSTGAYLFLDKIISFFYFIRGMSVDWLLIVLVLILIILMLVVRSNYKQKKRIDDLEKKLIKDCRDFRMVTHFGVWWKVYNDSEYIEDFPYCSCCDPFQKLVQTEWHPDEIFQCPNSKTPFKIFGDEVPLKRQVALDSLYRTYFRSLGRRIKSSFFEEHKRLKELNPQITEEELFNKLFQLSPLNRIPRDELNRIRERCRDSIQVFNFIERHFSKYKEFFRSK